MCRYILAIDQGTTSTRALIFDINGDVIGLGQKEINQIYPKPGWVEQNPEEIWRSVQEVILMALKDGGVNVEQIVGIGITNQRETTVVWDKETGKPVYNAIVWQCRRTSDIIKDLKEKGYEEIFRKKTGLVLDPYFSGTKVKWLLDNVRGIRKRAERGEILFGTIDTWLIWKLTGGRIHITDVTNASRTLMFNIHDLEWDEELLDLLGIPANILPEVKSCSEIYGNTSLEVLPGKEVPIAGIAGDQQAAAIGQGCFEKGMTKITYGTGGFMLMNTGKTAINSNNGLLTTVAWDINGKINYALEGSIFVAGAAVQWLRDELGLVTDSADTDYFARKVNDSNGVYIVPAFTGLGAPYWNPDARGMIIGLSRGCNKDHIIRATLESLVFQTKDVLMAMENDAGIELKDIRVDGGVSNNDFTMQFLADIIGSSVIRPYNRETTVIGAAFLAGIATGFWPNTAELSKINRVEKVFKQNMDQQNVTELCRGWDKAVETILFWSSKK